MRVLRKALSWCACAVIVLAPTRPALAFDSTTTSALFAQAVASYPACSFWHPSGTCFFLHCTFFGCSIRTSTRFSHFNPDLVVSTYHDDVTHPPDRLNLRALAALCDGLNCTASDLVEVYALHNNEDAPA